MVATPPAGRINEPLDVALEVRPPANTAVFFERACTICLLECVPRALRLPAGDSLGVDQRKVDVELFDRPDHFTATLRQRRCGLLVYRRECGPRQHLKLKRGDV